jgi:hypothetical protein
MPHSSDAPHARTTHSLAKDISATNGWVPTWVTAPGGSPHPSVSNTRTQSESTIAKKRPSLLYSTSSLGGPTTTASDKSKAVATRVPCHTHMCHTSHSLRRTRRQAGRQGHECVCVGGGGQLPPLPQTHLRIPDHELGWPKGRERFRGRLTLRSDRTYTQTHTIKYAVAGGVLPHTEAMLQPTPFAVQRGPGEKRL